MEKKMWVVRYHTASGRMSEVSVETRVMESRVAGGGTGKWGILTDFEVPSFTVNFDLRSIQEKNLHHFMLDSYFGQRLVDVKPVRYQEEE